MTDQISIKGLKKAYKQLQVLNGVDLNVERGTVLALLGPNGAGKTTIVRILSTLVQPDAGEVFVGGFDVVRNPKDVRKTIGLTGQYAAVDEYLTGRENLEMIGKLYHLSSRDSRTRAAQLLEEFDLVDAGERIAKTYSGGMRRRLDLALSLVATPPILFLDEPTTGLDPRSRIAIWDRIDQLKKSGTTILLTTQYLEEADKLADQVVVMDHGHIIANGTPNELKSNIGNERLELQFANSRELELAANVLRVEVTRQEDEDKLIVRIDGSISQLRGILESLEASGARVETFALHKPTLDDVFLQLTGHDSANNSNVNEQSKEALVKENVS